jgi:hypothetical protein
MANVVAPIVLIPEVLAALVVSIKGYGPAPLPVPKAEVADQISQLLGAAAHTSPESVSCPGDLTYAVDAQTTCEIAVHGKRSYVHVTVTSIDGDQAILDLTEGARP